MARPSYEAHDRPQAMCMDMSQLSTSRLNLVQLLRRVKPSAETTFDEWRNQSQKRDDTVAKGTGRPRSAFDRQVNYQ